MAPRRWLLIALSLSSLVVLSYAGIAVAFSVPITTEMAEENSLDGKGPRAGDRAVIAPIVAAKDVVTFARDPANTSMLLVAQRAAIFPAAAEQPSLVRALAYVSVLHNLSYAAPTIDFVDLPSADGPFNATVNVTQLANGQNGFFVKSDASREIRFVPSTGVVGEVARFESSLWIFGLVAFGALGFVAPLVALILTARPVKPARVGLPGAACPECRRPLPAGADFCMACGAWIPKG